MKIKDEYILQNIAGKDVVIDTNARSVNFNKILALNSTGKILWEQLEDGASCDSLATALVNQFGIDAERARIDAESFIRELTELGCIENEE